MPKHSLLAIHDHYRDGAVSRQIDAWRREGLSPSAIAVRLHDEGIDVDPSTVRRWLLATNGDAA